MKKTLAAVALAVLSLSANALLVDIPGANYSYDASTNLRWLDVRETWRLSYNDLVGGVGNDWYAQGWRFATGEQLSSLFATNLPLTTAPSSEHPGDYYAPLQADPTWSTRKLISIFGGSYDDEGGRRTLRGIFDRETDWKCDCPAHAFVWLVGSKATKSAGSSVRMDGGMLDGDTDPLWGHFLVKVNVGPVPVPEPSTAWLTLAGLLLTLPYLKHAKVRSGRNAS